MARLPRLRRIFGSFDELQQAAEGGDEQAQNELGMAYAMGAGVAQDRTAAFHWWMKSAEGGDPIAMERLAEIFRTGEVLLEKVTPIDTARAIHWYEKAAKRGNHEALFGLARVYQSQQEMKKAAAIFKESAYTYGKRESLREYGMCIYHGNGERLDIAKGRELIAEAALMDQEFSDLGCAYLAQNYGVKLRMPASIEERQERGYALERFQLTCLLRRAEAGDMDAQVELAHKYIFGGKQVEMNRDKALFWFRRAAEAGDAEAQYEMGRAAEAGGAGKKDPQGAYQWFHKAAEQGYLEGLREAGRCLYFGEGIPQDEKQAAIYFERAAALKDPESMIFLGKMLLEGRGVKKDVTRGKKLTEQALAEDTKGIGLARLRLEELNARDAAAQPKKRK